MDIFALARESLDELAASGKVKAAISEAVEKAMLGVIKEHFSSYSKFSKQLEKAVEQAFGLNGEIDLPSYNEQVLQIVRRQVEGYTHATLQQQVVKHMERLLEPPPESIKLSKLIETFVDQLRERERDDSGCVCYGEEKEKRATVILDEDRHVAGYKMIAFDEKPNKTLYQCRVRIAISKSGEVYNMSFENHDTEKRLFLGPFHDFEKLLFQMKCAKSKVEVDCDPSDCDLYYGNSGSD